MACILHAEMLQSPYLVYRKAAQKGEDKSMKHRIISIFLCAALLLSCSAAALAGETEAGVFSDVQESDWFYGAVMHARDKGLMNGSGDGAFNPNGFTDRAMIATILYRLEGSPEVTGENPFTDVPAEIWYEKPVIWAAGKGIVKGIAEGIFSPTATVTREQMAAMLYRYAQTRNQGFQGSWMFLLDFADAADISDWADEAMHWVVMNKIITGTTSTTLDPKGLASRAQVATIFQRFDENISAAEPEDESAVEVTNVDEYLAAMESGAKVIRAKDDFTVKADEAIPIGSDMRFSVPGTLTVEALGYIQNEGALKADKLIMKTMEKPKTLDAERWSYSPNLDNFGKAEFGSIALEGSDWYIEHTDEDGHTWKEYQSAHIFNGFEEGARDWETGEPLTFDNSGTSLTVTDTLTIGSSVRVQNNADCVLTAAGAVIEGLGTLENFGQLKLDQVTMKAGPEAKTVEEDTQYNASLRNFGTAVLGSLTMESAAWSVEHSDDQGTWTEFPGNPELRNGYGPEELNDTDNPRKNDGVSMTITGALVLPENVNLENCSGAAMNLSDLCLSVGCQLFNYGELQADKLTMLATAEKPEQVVEGKVYNSRFFNYAKAAVGSLTIESGSWEVQRTNEAGESWFDRPGAPEFRNGFWEDEQNWFTNQPGDNTGVSLTITGAVDTRSKIFNRAQMTVTEDAAVTLGKEGSLDNDGDLRFNGTLQGSADAWFSNNESGTAIFNGKITGASMTGDYENGVLNYLHWFDLNNAGKMTVNAAVDVERMINFGGTLTIGPEGDVTIRSSESPELRIFHICGNYDRGALIVQGKLTLNEGTWMELGTQSTLKLDGGTVANNGRVILDIEEADGKLEKSRPEDIDGTVGYMAVVSSSDCLKTALSDPEIMEIDLSGNTFALSEDLSTGAEIYILGDARVELDGATLTIHNQVLHIYNGEVTLTNGAKLLLIGNEKESIKVDSPQLANLSISAPEQLEDGTWQITVTAAAAQ